MSHFASNWNDLRIYSGVAEEWITPYCPIRGDVFASFSALAHSSHRAIAAGYNHGVDDCRVFCDIHLHRILQLFRRSVKVSNKSLAIKW